MSGSNHQAGEGKLAQQQFWAKSGFYRRRRLKKLAHVLSSLVGVGLS
jgi:hypothetical protein